MKNKTLLSILLISACMLCSCGDSSSSSNADTTTAKTEQTTTTTTEQTTNTTQTEQTTTKDETSNSALFSEDVIDDTFTTKTLNLVETADNTVETDDGALTFNISYGETGEEFTTHQGFITVTNNTENNFYIEISGIQAGSGQTAYTDKQSLLKLDANSKVENQPLHKFQYVKNEKNGMAFNDVKIIDAENKIVYECNNFFCDFK